MNRDDIIKIAKQSGVLSGYESELFQRFAILVAAAEREACANVVEQAGIEGHGTLAAAAMIRARGNEHWDKPHEEQERLFLEKFAELIVRECADIAREVGTSTDPEDFALDRCYEIEAKIKEHFGIDSWCRASLK